MNKTRTSGKERSNQKATASRRGRENPSRQREMVPVAEWEADVNTVHQGTKHAGMRCKVVCKGTRKIDVADLFDEALVLLRQGYEVRLSSQNEGEGIRLYPCVTNDYSTMFVCAMSMGSFRQALNDIPFRMKHRGDAIEPDAARKEKELKRRKINAERVHITPDTIITCNVCGNEMRVGKMLK